MTPATDPLANHLLAALEAADWQRWKPHLEPVNLRRGEILYAAGQPQFHAYFPTSAIISLLQVTEAGGSTGFAIAGHEGVVGISLLLGSDTATSGGSVLIAGQGFRMPALALQEEFNRFEAVRQLLLRYAQALITQITQTAVCSRHHTVDQQVCTWLLHCLDRLADNEIVVTHDALASLLGVRRESVTLVVGHLRAAGLIRCRRGCIEVLDRASLERRSCECHAVVSKEYARLLPRPSRSAPGGSDDGICATQRST
ncbi:MAG: Crp/Fnr family transcriptional regulator [Rubrivivax sp.]|jgi:CRP-like cAMP-binding protein|nr:Crp/Fnr family transcriptional regulator [Rubrivivax sp.]